jgi:hypothetical protein
MDKADVDWLTGQLLSTRPEQLLQIVLDVVRKQPGFGQLYPDHLALLDMLSADVFTYWISYPYVSMVQEWSNHFSNAKTTSTVRMNQQLVTTLWQRLFLNKDAQSTLMFNLLLNDIEGSDRFSSQVRSTVLHDLYIALRDFMKRKMADLKNDRRPLLSQSKPDEVPIHFLHGTRAIGGWAIFKVRKV